ncbi:PQQ-dependent sugar dehydrogenase [Tepidicaulis sp. LMO-SS28]|uniref:PQQ-dependent sugar dehydrogenase n=1 Tax=Tepidicaulis sp. LMO-SS28 TaxID=3447455 RepID=UPI003EE133E9
MTGLTTTGRKLAAAVLTGALLGAPAAALAQETEGPFEIETVAAGLDFPWSLAFLPDGDMLVTERGGDLRIIRDGALLPEPVSGVPESFVAGQGGLMEIALHPDFEENNQIYLSLAHGKSGENNTRVVRGTYEDGALSDVEVIFDAQPQKATPVHYGGRITFLPDETMLISLGDGFNYREEAQNLSNHFGKIVRLNLDGSVPEDNPFIGQEDAKPEIFSYGHRNVQGLVYDAPSGRIYEHEHGAQGGDEINILEPGKNYGWPVITGGVDYSGAQITPYTEYPGMEQPWVEWTPSIAPAGLAVYRGEMFADWEGDLLVAALAEMSLRRVDLENGEVQGQEILLEGLGKRLREVKVAPDGSIYILTDEAEGEVLRLTPAPAA